jgi:putative aldouronate transport system substrate-binding protein
MKKLICIFLAVAVVLAFGACRRGEEDPKTTTGTTGTGTGTTTEANPFEQFYEITWLTQLNADYRDGRWDEVELEEKFNVDLQCWAMDSRDTEGMAALVAAGDIPDFFYMSGAPREPVDMYKENLIRSINVKMFQDYLPGYYELISSIPIGLSYNLVPNTTDEYLGITTVNISGCQYFYDATCINLDWLQAVGFELDEDKMVPVKMTVEGYEKYNDNIYFTEGNFSFDDMKEIMRAFTEDDPDGNGEDDTYGMMYLPESAWTNMTQEGLFGFVHDLNYLYLDPTTKDVVPKYAYTPYRDYLAWVSEMLNKGYMRRLPGQETWTAEYQAISATNKVGIIQVNGGGYLSLNSDTYRVYPPQNILLTTDEDARFVIGPMFRGPDGKLVDMTYNIDPFGEGKWRVNMVGQQVDDGKLKRILQMMQYTVFSSQDNYNRYKYGIEGIHWKWAGEPYISNMIATPTAELPEEYRGQTNVYSLFVYPSAIEGQIRNATEHGYWSYMAYMHANDLFEKYALNPKKYRSEVYMGTDLWKQFNELNNELNSEINTVVNDFKNRALNGQIADFNTEWSEYIDRLYDAGLKTLVDEIYNNPDFKDYDPGEKFTLR